MSMLRPYINRVMQAKGLSRQVQLNNLRNYLKTARLNSLQIAISDITSEAQLRILWECGLKKDLQYEVLRRQQELEERRR